jgi:ribonuclease Z
MRHHRKSTAALTGLLLAGVLAAAYLLGRSDERTGRPFLLAQLAKAAESPAISPVKARPRDAYYPNSEDLRPDEMRVIACGTGMPTTRAAQAAACFLVQLRHGDKFIFDAGA